TKSERQDGGRSCQNANNLVISRTVSLRAKGRGKGYHVVPWRSGTAISEWWRLRCDSITLLSLFVSSAYPLPALPLARSGFQPNHADAENRAAYRRAPRWRLSLTNAWPPDAGPGGYRSARGEASSGVALTMGCLAWIVLPARLRFAILRSGIAPAP